MVVMDTSKKELFAVQAGDYVGQMFIVVEVTDQNVGCLSVPDMKNVKVPKDKFDFGRNHGIIEYVEDVPEPVFQVSEAQYAKNENSDN
jgi:hypothetical protein